MSILLPAAVIQIFQIIYFFAAVCKHMFACGYQNMSVCMRGCV